MKSDKYKAARDLICQARNILDDDCECCPLYNADNCYEQTAESEKILLAFFGKHPAEEEETEKEECSRSGSSAKSAKPYPQDTEEDEYRYIDASWLEAVARGLTAGAKKLNLYRAGDRKDTHLINAAMRCMMAYATEKARGEGQA